MRDQNNKLQLRSITDTTSDNNNNVSIRKKSKSKLKKSKNIFFKNLGNIDYSRYLSEERNRRLSRLKRLEISRLMAPKSSISREASSQELLDVKFVFFENFRKIFLLQKSLSIFTLATR